MELTNPKHYKIGSVEAITVIEDWNLDFHLGNVIKYIARACHKGDLIGDLKKASWYINRKIQLLEK